MAEKLRDAAYYLNNVDLILYAVYSLWKYCICRRVCDTDGQML